MAAMKVAETQRAELIDMIDPERTELALSQCPLMTQSGHQLL
jgi:hypothetical protein